MPSKAYGTNTEAVESGAIGGGIEAGQLTLELGGSATGVGHEGGDEAQACQLVVHGVLRQLFRIALGTIVRVGNTRRRQRMRQDEFGDGAGHARLLVETLEEFRHGVRVHARIHQRLHADAVGFLLGTIICLNIESIRQFLSWLTATELFSPELYFLSRLPAEIDVGETTAVVIMALTLSFLATLYPSWRAARLDPIEALRYE